MRFVLVDRIIALEPNARIVASKSLTLAEEYLADHFPAFPVMPGVLMLEAMVQSAAWLVQASQGFAHGMVVLEEAKNIKYKSFVAPGQTLEVVAEAIRIDQERSEFKTRGRCGDEEMVVARLTLRHYNLAQTNKALAGIDTKLIADARRIFELLGGPAALKSAAAPAGCC